MEVAEVKARALKFTPGHVFRASVVMTACPATVDLLDRLDHPDQLVSLALLELR